MAQYCRYCSSLSYGDVPYCCKREKVLSFDYVKRTNNCKEFQLNVMDALGENLNGYRPRKEPERSRYEQIEIDFE